MARYKTILNKLNKLSDDLYKTVIDKKKQLRDVTGTDGEKDVESDVFFFCGYLEGIEKAIMLVEYVRELEFEEKDHKK